ncbi:MAG: glycosyltransferase family 2 protein [Flavobacteriaceae bacterium]|nr:glycosyltransferase family 2 protein [Flavobacteriaceae bacterium]
MSQPKVAVVILNWNGKHWLERFLPSVLGSSYSNLEIIVGDNASSDDSMAFLQTYYKQVRIVQNAVNGGYAKGYNDCLKHVQADYYILLNSDIEVPSRWIEPVIELMESDKNIAACQPKILQYADKTKFEYAGACGGFMDHLGYMFCRGRIFDECETDNGQYDTAIETFWATGACLFVRAENYWQAGGLYEPLFAHMEEIDLCWRLKNLGHKIYVCPQSSVYHVGGGTLHKTSPRKTFLNFKNNLIIVLRNLPAGLAFRVLFLRLMLDGIAATRTATKGEFAAAWAIVRAWVSFVGSMGKWRRERPQGNSLSTHSGIYRKSILWQYFYYKKRMFSELGWL